MSLFQQIKNRWIGVCATAFITMVWCDLWYYASFEELARNNYGDWFEILWLYFAHTICAFVLLDLCSICYVRDKYGLFLASSISGWILTGCFQTTYYDTLPVSVSWRGLCWYSLVSVFCGLWLIRTLLHCAHKIWLFVFICCISGLLIACWSVWWMHGIGDYGATIPDISSCSLLLFVTTGILIISYFMLDKMYDVERFEPTQTERIIIWLSIVFAALYKIVFVGYLYMFLIAFVPSVGSISYLLMWRYRRISIKVRSNAQVWNALALPNPNSEETNSSLTQINLAQRDMISDLSDSEYDRLNLWILLIIPSVGSIAYTLIVHVQQHLNRKLPTATILNIFGIIVGFLFMFLSIWRVLMLNERVFLRNQYRSQIMDELEIEIELERMHMNEEKNEDENEDDQEQHINDTQTIQLQTG